MTECRPARTRPARIRPAPTRARLVSAAAVLLLASAGPVLVAAVPAAPATAAPAAPAAPAVVAGASAGSSAPTMVILDGSGSMLATDAPGSRIAAAKRAIGGLLGSLPADARLGLEVYGTSTSSAGAAKAAGCRDIRTIVPVGPVDRTRFLAQVAAVRASGYTPIGNALRRAAAQLPSEGARSIVLVSDGEDTCAPPEPCDVARELHRAGVDLNIHTVGFKVNERARRQLQCIAGATGGTYQDADSGTSLADRLQTQVDRALRGYQAQGTRITGSDNAGDGPLVRPGQYLDTFGPLPAGTTREASKYYSIDLTRGDTPYFSATVIPAARRVPLSATMQVQVQLSTAGNSACSIVDSGYDIGISGKISAATAVATPSSDADRECLSRGGPLTVKVTRSGPAFADEPVKMELAYHAEPPADAAGQPGPAALETKSVQVPAAGASTTVEAGSSFNDAPRLDPGVYRDTFVSGETRFVKVHVGWGQQLAYSLTPTKLPGLGLPDGVHGQLSITNPLRQRVGLAFDADTSDAFMGSYDSSMSGSTGVPVRYLNRTSDQSGVRPASVAGDYYLVLSTGFTATGRPSLTVPYTLRIGVIGTAQSGPRYLTDSDRSGSGAASASPSATGLPRARGDGGSSVPTAALLGGGGGAVVLIGAAIAVVLVRRRRARQARTADTATLPTHGW